jgi:hypothetical protein
VEAHPNETSYLSHHNVTAGQRNPAHGPELGRGVAVRIEPYRRHFLKRSIVPALPDFFFATPPALELLSVGSMAEETDISIRPLVIG